MLTRAGWSVAVGAAATIAAGRVFGLPELAVLGTTGLVLVVAAVVRVRRPLPDLHVTRTVHPTRVPVGGRSRVELHVANGGRRRTPLLTLHDPVAGTIGARVALAPLGPGASQSASYRLPTERRGVVEIGPLTAARTDAFGLAQRSGRVADVDVLTVLPSISPLPGGGFGSGLDDPLAGQPQRRAGGAGNEDFSTLRPYAVGDDLRRIHWPSSARADDLLVRQDDPPWRGHVTVLLDARADRIDPDRFELAVTACASILHAAARRADQARLIISDGTDTGLVDARAASDLLLEHLALVDRHEGASLPDAPADGRTRTGSLVLVSGSPSPADVAAVTARRSRFATIRVVAFEPPGAATPPDLGPGVEVVRVPPGTSFAAAWTAASRRAAGASRS
ncbi:MAG: DUF58 domain-containing protein [Actinobacteria bacterium]|nr:DUF58 domain-containing protein [Actinomycetota bacterium]